LAGEEADVTPRRLTFMLLPVWLALVPVPLAAQSFEAGGSLSASCIGSDGSLCSESELRTAGPAASVWLGERLELGARVVWFRLDDLSGRLSLQPEVIRTSVSDRKRVIAQGEVIWHLRPGKQLRPLVGFGVGRYWRTQVAACEPPGCEAALGPGFPSGQRRTSHADESAVLGLSVRAHPRLRVRGGWRYHNPFRDELAVSELFIAAGYVVGRF
jgi:hypothetical protein